MKGSPVEDLSLVRFPCWASPKIDGFRCVLARTAMTSRMARFPNRHFMKEMSHLLDHGMMLDGEVVVGDRREKGVLQRTSSGLTSEDGKPDFHLWVFDAPLIMGGFEQRLETARETIRKLGHERIHYLHHQWVEDLEELQAFIDYCLRKGYEGAITRAPLGHYKQGKSTIRENWMLKIKPFEDAEGRIVGWFEEMENTNEPKREITGKLKRSSAKAGKVGKGRLGGFILQDVQTKVEVRVGGGFSADQRRAYWAHRGDQLLGRLVKYKKQKVGEKDKPRHPNFVEFIDFRPEWDMDP